MSFMGINLKFLSEQSSSSIIRWIASGIILIAALIVLGYVWVWPANNLGVNILYFLLLAGLTSIIVVSLFELRKKITNIEKKASNDKRRSEAIFQLSRKFVESNCEDEVVSSLLQISSDLVEAVGASFVPLDERGQPLTAISFGGVPLEQMEAWVEYLASPEIRHSCSTCKQLGDFAQNCPLIEIPPLSDLDNQQPIEVYCLPLQRGDREYGILNLYLLESYNLDQENQVFLSALLDETALALESIRLQRREISLLDQLHKVQNKSELKNLEINFLENVKESLKASFILLRYSSQGNQLSKQLISGEIPESSEKFISAIVRSVYDSSKPILIGEVEGDSESVGGLYSLLAAPLIGPAEQPLGVLLAGNTNFQKFNRRQLTLLQVLARQISLVLQNSEQLAEFEFNTILAERNRLAREIHDGLAQTLGFLKLQAAQLGNYLAAEDTHRLQEGLSSTYKVLSDAYLDVRQAIDGLRLSANGGGLFSWLGATCIEFEENSDLKVIFEADGDDSDLPPEVQAQLIRIVQEALSNVRKHAQASQAWVVCLRNGEDFVIEIRDDGIGFSPDEIPDSSRYGLLGMRERSELIGAELQVLSNEGQGTLVRVSFPLEFSEELE
jgi:two-component system nitrate/nitrite sensor histidine kinase NarX